MFAAKIEVAINSHFLTAYMSGVDYTPDIRKRIRLLPPDDVMDDWYNDYKDMESSMIYGEKPSFEELIEKMRELENLFHNTKH